MKDWNTLHIEWCRLIFSAGENSVHMLEVTKKINVTPHKLKELKNMEQFLLSSDNTSWSSLQKAFVLVRLLWSLENIGWVGTKKKENLKILTLWRMSQAWGLWPEPAQSGCGFRLLTAYCGWQEIPFMLHPLLVLCFLLFLFYDLLYATFIKGGYSVVLFFKLVHKWTKLEAKQKAQFLHIFKPLHIHIL